VVLINGQGTATSFPELDELAEVAVSVGVVTALVLELAPVLVEITAKSILPEVGLNTRSLILPKVWP